MGSSLSRDDVAKVAELARLRLSEVEMLSLATEMGRVLEYVDVLNEVDTEEVEPMAHAIELSNVFREDEIQDSLSREEALANAPKTDGQYFLVPQILDGG